MNYLAHIFLSGNDPEILMGNLLEDFISGRVDHPRNNQYSDRVKIGIRLHRGIDTLTDTHELVKGCKVFFYPKFGKFSPIIIDVIFDHFLILNWKKLTNEPLETFINRTYVNLEKNLDKMPEPMQKMVKSMIEFNWLPNYAQKIGIERAFQNLNKKINYQLDLTEAIPLMEENFQVLNDIFMKFIKIMMDWCENFLKEEVNGQ